MTKPKADKPAVRESRERAAPLDQSNEGAQAERRDWRARVRRDLNRAIERMANDARGA